jgi:hypothetical protein
VGQSHHDCYARRQAEAYHPSCLAPASPGDYFDARFDAEEDALVFRRLAGKENWLTVLKACPASPEDV